MGQLSLILLHLRCQAPIQITLSNSQTEVDWEMGGQVNSQSYNPVLLQGAEIKATGIGLGKQLRQPFTWVWHSAGYRGVTTLAPFIFQQGPCYKETEAAEVLCHKSYRKQEAENKARIGTQIHFQTHCGHKLQKVLILGWGILAHSLDFLSLWNDFS